MVKGEAVAARSRALITKLFTRGWHLGQMQPQPWAWKCKLSSCRLTGSTLQAADRRLLNLIYLLSVLETDDLWGYFHEVGNTFCLCFSVLGCLASQRSAHRLPCRRYSPCWTSSAKGQGMAVGGVISVWLFTACLHLSVQAVDSSAYGISTEQPERLKRH